MSAPRSNRPRRAAAPPGRRRGRGIEEGRSDGSLTEIARLFANTADGVWVSGPRGEIQNIFAKLKVHSRLEAVAYVNRIAAGSRAPRRPEDAETPQYDERPGAGPARRRPRG
jgi:hypothetical protein